MSKHTPGPWIAHVSKVDEETGNDVMCIRTDGDQPMRGITGIEIKSPEDEANARLIAAAPDLLLACKGAIAAILLGEHVDTKMALAYLQDAIKKAEGRDE